MPRRQGGARLGLPAGDASRPSATARGRGTICSVNETLIGVVVGSVLSGVFAVALWQLSSRTEIARTKLEIDAQLHQTRYPDLVRAVTDFATEMRARNQAQALHESGSAGDRMVDDPNITQYGPVLRREPGAEVRLLSLRLFADEALSAAGQEWLEAFYVAWYDELPHLDAKLDRYDRLGRAEERFMAAARLALKVDPEPTG